MTTQTNDIVKNASAIDYKENSFRPIIIFQMNAILFSIVILIAACLK